MSTLDDDHFEREPMQSDWKPHRAWVVLPTILAAHCALAVACVGTDRRSSADVDDGGSSKDAAQGLDAAEDSDAAEGLDAAEDLDAGEGLDARIFDAAGDDASIDDGGYRDAAGQDAGCDRSGFDRCPPGCWYGCPAGRTFDVYTCSCIIPGRCDNGWDICNLDTPVCQDGKCVDCNAKDARRCRLQGKKCETESFKCVTDCAKPCEPGTERDYFTCECFTPTPCMDGGCPYWMPACFENKCVQCTEEMKQECSGEEVCNPKGHRCVGPAEPDILGSDAGVADSSVEAGALDDDAGDATLVDAEAGL